MPSEIPDEQLRNEFGTRATHPAGEGEIEGDRYQNDGSGVIPADEYLYHAGSWGQVGKKLIILDEAVPIDTDVNEIDFVGAGVTSAPTGPGKVSVTIPGGGGTPLAVLDEGAPIDPNVGQMDFIGTGVTVAPVAPGQVSVTIPSGDGGRDERPTDFVELHTIPAFACNGNSGQRCNTILADGRELHLWRDNDSGITYLTVKNPFYSDLQAGDYARHTRVYPLDMREYGTEEPIFPTIDSDFCITSEVGDAEGEMIHIVIHAQDTIAGSQIWDGYFPSANLPWIDLSGTMNNNPGDPGLNLPVPYGDGGATPNMLFFEIVNQIRDFGEANPCRHPSCCANPNLLNGAGIAIVWSQYGTPVEPLGWGIYSNFYDPNQVSGQRYNTLLTGYVEGYLNVPGMANCDYPTVECTVNDIHCSYLETDIGFLYYSTTPAVGIFAIPPAWDGVCGFPVNSFGSGSGFFSYAPSMCVIDNLDDGQTNLVIAIIGDAFYCYAFDMLGILAGAPLFFFEQNLALIDASKDDNDIRYQLGASDYQFQSGTNNFPLMYLYRTMKPRFVSNVDRAIDYILSMKPFNLIRDGELEAWEQITLRSGIAFTFGGTPYFSPKVNYSFMYNKRGWRNPTTNPHYYPLNNFFITKLQFELVGTLASGFIMIANEFVSERPPPPPP